MGSDGEKKQQFQIMNNYPSDLAKYAAEGNKAKVAELLQAGADITPVDSLEQTALIYCVREVSETEQNALDRAECTRLLINAGADIKATDSAGRNVWGVAHDWHHEEILELLKRQDFHYYEGDVLAFPPAPKWRPEHRGKL